MRLTITTTFTISILLMIMISITINSSNGLEYEYTQINTQVVNPFAESASPAINWNKTNRVTNSDYGAIHQMIKTQDGGYALAGTSLDYESSHQEKFVVLKTDASGNKQWAYSYSVGSVGARANSIIQTNDGGYAIAGFKSPLITVDYSNFSQGYSTSNYQAVTTCLLKINSTGSIQWTKYYDYNGTDDAGISVVQTNDGGYAIVGFTQPSNGTQDVYLVKTDSNGDLQWSKTYGLNGNDCGMSIVKNNDGGYTIAGYSQDPDTGDYSYLLFKTDSQGTQQWSNVYGGADSFANSLLQTNDGGYALIGSTSYFGAGKDDFYLVKTNSEGELQWGTAYGGSNDDAGYSIVQTNDGYAIAGYTSSFGENNTAVYSNGYLIKTDSNGITQWSKVFGGNSTDNVYSVIQLDDGSYAIAGDTRTGSYSTMELDFFGNYKRYPSYRLWLIKIASDGSSPPVPTPSPTPVVTATPVPTVAPTSAPTPTPKPTVTPSPTNSQSHTPTPTATIELSPTIPEFPTTIALVSVIVIGTGMLVYFKKHKE